MSTAHVERVRATAFAKLTLSLRVLGPPRADGFHDVEALTVPIGQPHDALEAVAAPDQPGITLDVVAGDDGVPTGRENLAVRAAESLLARSRRGGRGVQLALRKRIPSARGLGGGSADAAASLLAVHQLLEAKVPDAELFALAADLGSDVPFFLAGGAAWMRGRGDVLERVALRPGLPMLVVMPPFPLATVDVYRAWDDLAGPRSPRSVPSPEPIAGLVPELVNDLEPAAEQVDPRLRPLRERIEDAAGRGALMAGSGPTYVVLADRPVGLPERAEELSGAVGVPVLAAATVSKAVRLEV
ncbi:MAG TPA: 4-(cytidine 5'-diphospho)-2-C-methyl-D-erythritol kinase [Acidimicrobiia bacterium]|nr:4-(cytidine 5'-diphospho)-2-C-methyl-D-erythritol kinase [Acidimicrobiia bacterium]